MMTPVMTSSDQLNLAHLDDMTGGDNLLRADILGFFAENAKGYIGELSALAKAPSSDAEAFRAMSHKLKGAARAVGAYKIADLAERCEGMGEASDASKSEVVDQLNAHLSAIEKIAAEFSTPA